MRSNRQTILSWFKQGYLSQNNIQQALIVANAEPKVQDWLNFIKTAALYLGLLSFASGLIFFFAYNWADISRFSKFGIIQTFIVLASVALVFLVKPNHSKSTQPVKQPLPVLFRAITFFIALLIGSLLALIGQTYQTGADPWQLFFIWSVFITPLAIISRDNLIWILWLGLLGLSLGLYYELAQSIFGIMLSSAEFIWLMLSLSGLLLVLFEWAYWSSQKSISTNNKKVYKLSQHFYCGNRLLAQLLGLAFGFGASMQMMFALFDSHSSAAITYQIAFIVYPLWLGAGFYFYRYLIKDLLLLSAMSLSAIWIVVSLLIKAIGDSFDDSIFLVISFVIIGLSTWAGIYLKSLATQFSQEEL
jgi:uncharacterized membrane protein